MSWHEVGNQPVFASAGKQTNPVDQTIHADTGALDAGVYEVNGMMGGSVAAVWQIQRRNAANSVNVAPSPYTVYTSAGSSVWVDLTILVEQNERVRITNDGALTGTTAATLQVEKLL